MSQYSPYLGWLVPYEWQEMLYDEGPESNEYPEDCDADGYLIHQTGD